jgi:hypothetical protein
MANPPTCAPTNSRRRGTILAFSHLRWNRVSSGFSISSLPVASTPITDVVRDYGSSDITVHNYGTADEFEQRILWLKALKRPIMCTEFMARPAGSTFEAILPVAHRHEVGAICWGLVRGKTQTHLPWDNWIAPLADFPPEDWFHDIFRPDGTPHDEAEVEFIRMISKVAYYVEPANTLTTRQSCLSPLRNVSAFWRPARPNS